MIQCCDAVWNQCSTERFLASDTPCHRDLLELCQASGCPQRHNTKKRKSIKPERQPTPRAKTMEEPRRSKKSRDKKDKKKKKSGVRTKFLIESLRQDYYSLRDENDRLRELVQTHLPKDAAEAILADCFDLTSPSAKVSSIDELTEKVPGMNIAEGDEEDEDEDY